MPLAWEVRRLCAETIAVPHGNINRLIFYTGQSIDFRRYWALQRERDMGRVFSARDRRFGGYLEDYEAGDTYRHWPGKTITEADDHMFCLLTMAASPLHIDRKFAETELEFGRNIVVGTYIYSLLLGMSVPDISGRAIANLGVSELRHLAPMFHGDTLYGASEVLSARKSKSRAGQGILTVRTDGFNQDDLHVCTFTRSVLLPCRPEEGT
jgi:acyl dehydratase